MRRRPLSVLVAVLALVVTGLAVGPARAEATAVVAVHDDYFDPRDVAIDPGDTVRWEVEGTGHSITANDGSFEYPEDPTALLGPGDVVEHRFDQPGVFYYFCRIHGSPGTGDGMTGTVYVGMPVGEPAEEVRRVPSEFPTIKAAMTGIPARSTISVAPGRYSEAVRIGVEGVTVKGEGDTAGAVVLEAPEEEGVGVAMVAKDATLANVTVRGARTIGIEARDVVGFSVVDVAVEGATTGVRTSGGRSGGFKRVAVRGSPQAGFDIGLCGSCGMVLEEGSVTNSPVGIVLPGSSGVVVRDMSIEATTTGIDAIGTQAVEIVGSRVTGGDVGISVRTGILPSLNVKVVDNVVTGYASAGIQWDLAGYQVCFSGNTDPAKGDGQPFTLPPLLQTLFPCR